jgi:hypothetical protein
VVALLRDHLAPRLIGRDAREIEAIWKDLFFATHATAVGASRASPAAIDTALWDLECRRAALPLGGWPAARTAVPVYTTEGGWLHHSAQQLVDEAHAAKAQASRRQDQGRQASIAEDVARLAAVRTRSATASRSWSTRTRRSRSPKRCRAPMPIGLCRSAGSRSRCRRGLGGHVELAAKATMPIAVGESLYHPSHFREYLERRACTVVQVDLRADRRHHALAQGRASGARRSTCRLSALPDGAPRVAVGGGAERRVGGVHSAT